MHNKVFTEKQKLSEFWKSGFPIQSTYVTFVIILFSDSYKVKLIKNLRH